ncbi:unnamed protein product [Cylindrotheca closterium]|uniref:SnoaL-like domain-containing protein n=1 Tax=Cylindrotheca closterium TaxID=2856 RepID=A0AAD2CSE7_9STRA|nr:unnamed protein product [Cylindrotheca closterium]
MKLVAFLLLILPLIVNCLVAPQRMNPPETKIREQLDALKVADFERAFSCYSDDSQVVLGDVENFAEVASQSPFEFLVEHEDAQVVMVSTVMDPDVASCLVKVVFGKKWRKKRRNCAPCLYYTWELSRDDEDSEWEIEAFFPDFDDVDFDAIELIGVDDDEEGEMFGFEF